MLYLVATPIGNLADISLRALEVLKSSSLILCEDTRVSRTLLRHYDIHTPLESFHQFSEAAKEDKVLKRLKEGEILSLISDAGTPTISDPGYRLVHRCREEGIAVSSIPGACAAIAALTISGLSTERFQFIGFLPRKEGPLKQILLDNLHYPGTTICYESPERLLDTLDVIKKLDPQKQLVVVRELTKHFEDWQKGNAEELIAHYSTHILKGEIILLIEPCKNGSEWEALSPEKHVKWLEESYNLSKKEAIKLAAEMRGAPKRDIYKSILNK